ncbi:DNA mismatch repair protein MutT [Clostridium sp. CF012]|uniref:DNA mismatch repair protein MutT n=1 Tax=Clostridium sp. CF012 TaxID=2843319 RepID=UPI001C0D213B|nr:DNA mismatch repair protein MutT [Clostridium sp. CF012]MBU3143374.1 DNA mismatch repair protein MutT [Clostridium sp. CF012]
MGKVVRCSIIICDDFNAVLIAARGKKKIQKVWSIFGKDIKGKETSEQCVCKAIDKDLNCTIFDMMPYKEYVLATDSGDTLLVYTGKVKHYINTHKDISQIKWITERDLDMYDFDSEEKEILIDFFKSMK